jgi:hypothetical protein
LQAEKFSNWRAASSGTQMPFGQLDPPPAKGIGGLEVLTSIRQADSAAAAMPSTRTQALAAFREVGISVPFTASRVSTGG